MFLRGIAPGLALLTVFGLVRPALGEGVLQTATTLTAPQPRTLAQTWASNPPPPAPAGPPVICAPPPEPTPVYMRLSFWLTVGIVAVVGVATGVLLERRNHGLDMPSTTFGTKSF